MNRRNAIIGALILGVAGISSYPLFQWNLYASQRDLSSLISNKELIAELAECIIPETDTPGAKKAGVHNFIIKVISDCTDARNQRNFIKGLDGLQKYVKQRYDKTFIECSSLERNEVLTYFGEDDRSSNVFFKKVKRKIFGDTFFTLLKQYTVIGYCTSMIGATQGLAYDFIPSKYEPCINILKDQKSWATK